jgi:hypothetical protein
MICPPLNFIPGGNTEDETVLTPNHFLIGQAGSQLAPRVMEDIACSLRHRWKYIQQLVTQIWCRWNKEFLSLLQTRGKWLDIKEDREVGDIVLPIPRESGRWVALWKPSCVLIIM